MKHILIEKLGLTKASLTVFIKLLKDSTEFGGQCISDRVAETLVNPKSMTGHLTVLKKKGLIETGYCEVEHCTHVRLTEKAEKLYDLFIQRDKYDHKTNKMPIVLLTEAIEKVNADDFSFLPKLG